LNVEPGKFQDRRELSIVFSIIGCLGTASSFILMKYAHNRISRMPGKNSAYCDAYWLIGFIVLIFGSLFNIVALSLGNQMFLARSSSITVISNVILSVIFLKEHLYYIDVIGILIACMGSVVFYSQALDSPPNKYHDKDHMFGLYT